MHDEFLLERRTRRADGRRGRACAAVEAPVLSFMTVRCARVRGVSRVYRLIGGIQLTGLVQVRGAPGTRRSRAVQARWVATASRWDRLGPLGLRVDDEVAVADRLVLDGELEDAVEHHAAAVRSAAVEAEYELVQVALQVGLVDRALVGAQQPALGQGGDAVHSGQQLTGVLAAGAGSALATPVTGVAQPLDPAVALPAVGDDGGTRLDVRGDEWVQAGRRGIRDDAHPYSAVAAGLVDLDRHCHKGFLALGPPAGRQARAPARRCRSRRPL